MIDKLKLITLLLVNLRLNKPIDSLLNIIRESRVNQNDVIKIVLNILSTNRNNSTVIKLILVCLQSKIEPLLFKDNESKQSTLQKEEIIEILREVTEIGLETDTGDFTILCYRGLYFYLTDRYWEAYLIFDFLYKNKRIESKVLIYIYIKCMLKIRLHKNCFNIFNKFEEFTFYINCYKDLLRCNYLQTIDACNSTLDSLNRNLDNPDQEILKSISITLRAFSELRQEAIDLSNKETTLYEDGLNFLKQDKISELKKVIQDLVDLSKIELASQLTPISLYKATYLIGLSYEYDDDLPNERVIKLYEDLYNDCAGREEFFDDNRDMIKLVSEIHIRRGEYQKAINALGFILPDASLLHHTQDSFYIDIDIVVLFSGCLVCLDLIEEVDKFIKPYFENSEVSAYVSDIYIINLLDLNKGKEALSAYKKVVKDIGTCSRCHLGYMAYISVLEKDITKAEIYLDSFRNSDQDTLYSIIKGKLEKLKLSKNK